MTVTKPSISLTVTTGDTMEFSGSEVISATVVREASPISAELPISTIECKVLNEDDTFSMFQGDRFQLLSERLPMVVYESINGVQQYLGKFYLLSWKNTSEKVYQFEGIDLLGILDATDFDGMFWENPTPVSVILSDILSPVSVGFDLDYTFDAVTLHGWAPPGNCRQALQQVLFAAGAAVSTAKSDKLDIAPLILPYNYKIFDPDMGNILDPDSGVIRDDDPLAGWTETYVFEIQSPDYEMILDPDGGTILDGESTAMLTIYPSGKLRDQPVDLLPVVTSIELVSHNYSESTVTDNIFDKYLEAGNHKIIFDKPYYVPSIVITGGGYTPAELVTEGGVLFVTEGDETIEAGGEYDIGPNSLRLSMDAPDTVTITGHSWLDSKKSYLFAESGLTQFVNKNALIVASATMVSSDNAEAVLARLRDYYRLRYKQNVKLLPSTLTVGDNVLNGTLYDKQIFGTITKMSMDLTAGFIATSDIVGMEYTG